MEVEEGERVTIRVSSRRPVRAKLVDEPLPGFSVERTGLGDALDRPDAGVRIATSRHGTPLAAASLEGYVERAARDGLTVAFGAPKRGLPPMLGLTGDEVSEAVADPSTDAPARFDAWLNTIPSQGSEVVRTEEAMFASLGCLTLTE
jgi:predicted SPOUT superfamily RNA methylase MTH1